MEKRQTCLLIFILVLAGFLRFWQLGKVPPSPDWDEAALGYNAYSIMKTGRDEYGQLFPLILRSFDDYKPAIFAYLVIPSIKIFGLNTFAVRFSAALLGTLAVLLVYFLVKELFISRRSASTSVRLSSSTAPSLLSKNSRPRPARCMLPLIVSFLLAISPWHLQFSRIAFETNVGLFFDILIVLLILKAFKKPWLLILAAFFAGLNLYVYQAEKVFLPLLLLLVFLIWRQRLLKVPRKYLVGALALGFVLTLPFVYLTLTTPEIFLRAKGTSITADQTPFLARTVEKLSRDYKSRDYLGLILDNRRVTYFLAFVNGYLSHFDFNWLLITGDEARHHAPGMGLLYLVELPFLLLGIYSLIFARPGSKQAGVSRKAKWLTFGWIFLAPIPSAFTTGVPHAVRTIRFLPIPQILVAFGLLKAWQLINKKKPALKVLAIGLAMVFFIFNFAYFLNQYFIQQNYFNSQSWQYGYGQAIDEIKKIESKYQKIIVSNEPHLDQSYMFFLFYLKYDPALYQELGGTVSGGFAEEHRSFLKYVFRPIKWEVEEETPEILYVGRPSDFPDGVKVIKTINFLDGQPAIKLVEG